MNLNPSYVLILLTADSCAFERHMTSTRKPESVKTRGRDSCAIADPVLSREELIINTFSLLQSFTCRNCGGGDRGRVAIYRPFGEVSLSLNRTVTCMVLKANDRRTSCPCHAEFRGPRSDYVRQVALATTTT
ncbi:uncharacterized protein TNCV_4486001 [Trichonephila clavipes]|nr:uncharacterized protein TNCV_4486001 [Trichonephila clavipes]